ncbi:glycine-rich cell wall structural protein-like [Zingiber officinale]|uniref:glycine-rich cell wall structural protein-like n=1 Tax=Zingiber officinale TaxID=94328 RepID=UPI001C4BF088|nr:glycine-rich cell wall structural protein-like [Zingiber officinale]
MDSIPHPLSVSILSEASSNPPSELELHKLRKTHLKLISLRFHDGGLAKNLGVKGIARGGGGRWQQEVLDPEDLDALGALESRRRNRCHRGKGGKSLTEAAAGGGGGGRGSGRGPGYGSGSNSGYGEGVGGGSAGGYCRGGKGSGGRERGSDSSGSGSSSCYGLGYGEGTGGGNAGGYGKGGDCGGRGGGGEVGVVGSISGYLTVRGGVAGNVGGYGRVAAVEVVAAEEREAVMGQEDPDPGKGMDPAMALA